MSDVSPDEFASAYHALGETIIDPSTWPKVMERICGAVGATGALLLQTDVRTPDVPRTESLQESVDHYFRDGWQTRDIRAERAVPLLLDGKRAFIDQDILTLDELHAAQYINECSLPNGFKWAAGVGFSAGSALWALCFHRTSKEEPFTAKDSRFLATLSERLSEAATLSSVIGRVALTSATNAFDLVCLPAIAIDRLGYVLDANNAACGMFDGELRIRNRRLVTSDLQANNLLQKLIDRLLATDDSEPLSREPIIVRRKRNGSVVIRILPVHFIARNPFLGARALLTFSPVESRRRRDPNLLVRLFGLTPAESKLAACIAEGVSLEVAAEEFGISRETARNQLKSIFSKTNTHRQAQLVAIIANLY
jgi:DNA-binding CsgD family transcriptional regulator